MLAQMVPYLALVGFLAYLLVVSAALIRERSRLTGSSENAIAGTIFATLAAVFTWAVIELVLAAKGAFYTYAGRPPLALGLGVGVPTIIGIAAVLAPGRFREMIERLPSDWLIRVHAIRVLGVVFVILWALGKLPIHFALSAGLGDMTAGFFAPTVAEIVRRKQSNWFAVATVWNWFGILDLVSAILLGVGSSNTMARFIFDHPSSSALGQFPLTIIPTFLVPNLFVLHAASLRSLARFRASSAALPSTAVAR